MSFLPTKKLEVWRTLLSGQQVMVGLLAQNNQGVFFQYSDEYIKSFSNLSPFGLKLDNELQLAPKQPHYGLHGAFIDSLPDGWGLLLMDRVFRQQGILSNRVTSMDRLSFVGDSALGALCYRPMSTLVPEANEQTIGLADLGLQAQAVFDGQTDEVLSALVAAGSSGGARPKAQIYIYEGQFDKCRTQPKSNDEAWLVKFTSQNLALGYEEGLCEAVYLKLAQQAGLAVPEWQLIPAPEKSGASFWLALKRFDWVSHSNGHHGRYHMHSACGLLDADFRSPSLDYQDLIKASSILCKSPVVGQIQFRRALFNLFALNQDDHSKNWAFLQNDQGDWSLAPFYDVTFSANPYGEHATAFGGYGKKPPLKTIQQLATIANYANWTEARIALQQIVDSLSNFSTEAKAVGVEQSTIKLIQQQLNRSYQDNKGLLI
ncbi:type II toxin-antitoxin system HipA family toxin [uncultured Shewanella sp.]|uniref:type II toxin-antitoxin system HipA family toxin n=1 Tax=uncultured Shewanella sp. TaxID=173975 RepID=UPI00262D647E|nr:type II toxin-antitoxin system HipA family toxin [uncultured Shewanella sp.]